MLKNPASSHSKTLVIKRKKAYTLLCLTRRYLLLFLIGLSPLSFAAESRCYGTTASGRLEGGVKLPSRGKNFVSYSKIAELAGRTYVHTTVKKIVLAAYQTLATELPDKVFKYAETGFKNGGKFRPHKTHQNGLSVDFMTPVVDATGKSVHLPTHTGNRLGYDIEFDKQGNYQELSIDYEAMAAHLQALHQQAKKAGYDLWRVIFDPTLQPYLFKTQYGDYLKKNIRFSKRRSWVRHDEHYHVDFLIPCRSL